MAFAFNHSRSLRRHMKCSDGWINFSVGICTETGSVAQTISFNEGRVRVARGVNGGSDVVLRALDDAALKELALAPPSEVLNMMLRNRLMIEGNIACLQLFTYYLSLLSGSMHEKMLDRVRKDEIDTRRRESCTIKPGLAVSLGARRNEHLKSGPKEDRNVIHLEDPYLPDLDLQDFPRLKKLLERHRRSRPELCAERPRLLTEWYRGTGLRR